MKLHILEIPEETSELASWVEQRIMSASFGEFAGQLQAVRDSEPTAEPPLGLNQILGESMGKVVDFGLVSCSQKQIRQLLSNPTALFELQGLVYESGSNYWLVKVGGRSSNSQVLTAIKTTIENADGAVGLADYRSTEKEAQVIQKPTRRAFHWKMLAMTAGILLMATVAWNLRPRDNVPQLANWGWLAEDAMPTDATPSEYLAKISKGGAAWLDRKVNTAGDYMERLGELNQGCEILINADHPVLSAEDREWLVSKCKAWKVKFDDQLRRANSDSQNFEKYLLETDETIKSLINALNEKAKSV